MNNVEFRLGLLCSERHAQLQVLGWQSNETELRLIVLRSRTSHTAYLMLWRYHQKLLVLMRSVV